MKKVLSLFMSLVMLISITAGLDLTVSAETSGDFEYTVLGNGTAEITKYTGIATELSIPSTIDYYTVTSIGAGAFEFCSSLTSITIPDSVTSIGVYAFYLCNSLTSVTMPDSVTSIGYAAFFGTAYYNNESNWVDDVLYIDKALIAAKETISGDYSIKENTTIIADNAFSNCKSLTSIIIPDSVTSINDETFGNCSSLTSVIIPESVTNIGDSAFYRCDSLTDVYYSGAKDHWIAIYIDLDNECLTNAIIHCTDGILNETETPTETTTEPTTQPTTKPTDTTTQPTTLPPTQIPTQAPTSLPQSASSTTTTATQPTAQSQQEITDKNVTTTKPSSINVSGKVYKLDKNGDYVSSKVKKPSISKASKAKKSFKVAWKKISAVSGYQVQYSTSKKFTKKTAKTKTVKGNKSKKPSATIKNLKSKKTYYVRVRTYKTVKVNGKTTKVYSSWSKAKSVKTK